MDFDYEKRLAIMDEECVDYEDDCDLDFGFDPYEGCYTYDC